MKKSIRRSLATLTLVLSLVAAFAIPASATHSWGSYHWARTTSSFTLKLGDNLSATWDPYHAVASSDWSASTKLDTTIVAGSSSPSTCNPTSGRVQVCNYTYGSTGWLGIASIWADGSSHITQGTVKMNDTYFNTAQYNTPEWRQMVICQEVGHTFGLAHQDENFTNPNLNTCMDYTNLPASNQHPNSHDYNQLVTIYTHTDGYNTALGGVPGPSAAAGIDTNNPANWGTLVSSSADGVHQTFVRTFPGGTQLITDVFWAQ